MLPTARLGIILSSSNRCVEPYFREHAPIALALHYTRMRMAAGLRGGAEAVRADAIAAAELMADARVDAIDLQATGIIMEAGPEAEVALVAEITGQTGLPAYTATQAIVEGVAALGLKTVALVTPFNDAANARERAYLEARGIAVGGEFGLGSGGGMETASIPAAKWLEAAIESDGPGIEGFVMSGSNTTMVHAITAIEAATGKPVVTSVQAALWAGVHRLRDKLGGAAPSPEMGKLFTVP